MSTHVHRLLAAYARLVERSAVPRNRIGLNLFRVLAGSMILLQYLLNYRERFFLFGPDGITAEVFTARAAQAFSLYHFLRQPLAFDLAFHAGMLVTLGWVLGYRTRLLTPLTYVFWSSLHETNTFLWDGGDNLLQLVLLYACFADLSPLRAAAVEGSPRTLRTELSGLLHNAAVLAFSLQLCVLYAVSGLAKLQGEVWQNGTALYYALWPAQFRFPGLSELLFEDAFVLALATYATVAFQVSFPFLFLLNRHTRRLALLLATGFHLGIAGVMGLFTFAGFMIAADLALVDDAAYRALARSLRGAGQGVRRRVARWRPWLGKAAGTLTG